MKAETKKHLGYAFMVLLALIGIYLTIKLAGKGATVFNPAAAGSDQPGIGSSGGATGAATINLVGGTFPPLNITLPTQPGSNYQGGTNQLYLPVISNYIQQGNGGCNSCAQGNGALLGSELETNAAITAAMLTYAGDTKVGNSLAAPGYYNLSGQPTNALNSAQIGLGAQPYNPTLNAVLTNFGVG